MCVYMDRPYGSGKSSLAVMLNALLSHGKSNSYKIASTTLIMIQLKPLTIPLKTLKIEPLYL